MQIFKIDTDGNAAVKDIEGDLKSLQTEVGGLLTLAPYYEELENYGVDIFADDEGLLKANPKTLPLKLVHLRIIMRIILEEQSIQMVKTIL